MKIPVLILLILAALVAAPAAQASDPPLPPPGACPGDAITASTAQQAESMLCLINAVRAAKGLPGLEASPLLSDSARDKLTDELRCNDFSHTACGRDFTDPFKAAGYAGAGFQWKVGENLSVGSGVLASPRATVEAWLASPDHRANILSSEWRDQGIALEQQVTLAGISAASAWVSHFGARETGTSGPTPAADPDGAGAAGGKQRGCGKSRARLKKASAKTKKRCATKKGKSRR